MFASTLATGATTRTDFPTHVSRPKFVQHAVDSPVRQAADVNGLQTRSQMEMGKMNFHRFALIVAVLAFPCSANAFWFGSNGSCGGCNSCAQSCNSGCESSCGSHGGSFGGCFSRMFSHGSCGSCGGHSMGCGCQSSCGCESNCGCGHEASSCGCGGEVKEDSKPEAAPAAPAPAEAKK